MVSTEKARLLVLVADRTEVAAHDLELGILADVIRGHFEDAEMEICEGREGAACDKDYRSLGRILEDAR